MTFSEIPQEFLDACVSYREANTVNIARHWQDNTQRSPIIPKVSYTLYDDFTDTTSSPYSVSEPEAVWYYAGLPSRPLLVYRTGSTPWEPPTGMEAYAVLKELKPVFSHKIVTVWGDLGPKVCSCLDSLQVTWTSIDVVRFSEVGKTPGPTVLWIGVMPQSLSAEDAHTAAVGCLELLESYKINDVEVEFRESVFARSARPKLLEPGGDPKMGQNFYSNAVSHVRGPLTPALGLQIASRATPYAEGTGGLYISEGSNSDKVYILSTRHVVFPPSAWNNELYNHMNIISHSREVILPGPKAFQTLLQSTMDKMGEHIFNVDYHKRQLSSNELRDAEHRMWIECDLKREEKAIKEINDFHDKVTKYWSEEGQRVLGHIAYSPPITVGTGPENYTEDWALIELDRNKIDLNTFRGNVMDLGPKIPMFDVIRRLHPSPEPFNPEPPSSFEYPFDRLLPLQGIIEEDELRLPQMRDPDGEPYLHVIKSGCATGVTIGRATGVKSFVREYFPDGSHQTSMEWAILPYDQKSRAFSAPGDSGATIVDGKGRIGGLLTGGAGNTVEKPDITDITYATPFYWLLQRIQTHLPNAHLYERTALGVATSTSAS